MPTFQLRVVNSHFTARQDIEAADIEAAKRDGLKAALEIGSEEVCKGKEFFGATVTVEEQGEVRSHVVIAIGQSALQ